MLGFRGLTLGFRAISLGVEECIRLGKSKDTRMLLVSCSFCLLGQIEILIHSELYLVGSYCVYIRAPL